MKLSSLKSLGFFLISSVFLTINVFADLSNIGSEKAGAGDVNSLQEYKQKQKLSTSNSQAQDAKVSTDFLLMLPMISLSQ